MKDRVRVWMSRDQFKQLWALLIAQDASRRLVELAVFEQHCPGVFQDLFANLCDAEWNNANWAKEGEEEKEDKRDVADFQRGVRLEDIRAEKAALRDKEGER